jgi:uncharacterized RDD family membrane protein YckC
VTASGTEDYSVFTPERVSLRYDIAGIGSRGAAALIDTTIQAVAGLAVVIVIIFITTLGFRFGGVWESPWFAVFTLILYALGGFFLLWGYYIVFEIVWSGQTPGKRALGLRVIRENGYPLRPGDAVVRNLIRILDAPPLGAVVGSLVMLCNDRAKRIGDFAAGTIVVREGKRQRLGELGHIAAVPTAAGRGAAGVAGAPGAVGAAAGAASAEMPVMPSLSADDATLVRDFLVRRAEMYPDARSALAVRLAEHLSRRYGYPSPERGAAERFLESLASG